MKKLLLSFSAIVVLALPNAKAQLINSNFEQWSRDYLVPSAMDPNTGMGTSGWWDFNFLNSSAYGSSPVTVFKDTVNPTAYIDTSCAKIITRAMSKKSIDTMRYYGIEIPDTGGVIFSGFCDLRTNFTLKQGIPCNNAYRSFTFYFRYYPNGVDTCSCSVEMFHYNTTTLQRDLVGSGYWWFNHSVILWSPATVNISYTSSETPDTVLIKFSAASLNSKPQAGDTMTIDYGSVVLGMDNIKDGGADVKLYPNPATDFINLYISPGFNTSKVLVYDITGRLTGEYPVHNNHLTINTRPYSPGIYFYKLLDDSGGLLSVGKFSVSGNH